MSKELNIYIYYKAYPRPKNFQYEFKLKSIIVPIGNVIVPKGAVLFKTDKAVKVAYAGWLRKKKCGLCVNLALSIRQSFATLSQIIES